MSPKKRNKPPPTSELDPKKSKNTVKIDEKTGPLAWTSGSVHVLLPSDQQLLFVGTGTLAVQSGEIEVGGSIRAANSKPLDLCTDSSWPISITVVSTDGTVPLATSGGAAFTITTTPFQHNQIDNSNDDEINSEITFKIELINNDNEEIIPSRVSNASIVDIPDVWKQVAADIAASIQEGQHQGGLPPPIITICGAKKVGKSTFARYLANTLLNNHSCVAYLDTDCGQPEFSPPGLVSLTLVKFPILGPPHLHQKSTLDASYFIGDVSPATDPSRYLKCITLLYEQYKRKGYFNKKVPLIVNCHGWVKGFGFDLLVKTLKALSPSHVVNILSSNPRRNLPQGIFWQQHSPDYALNTTNTSRNTNIMSVLYDLPALGPISSNTIFAQQDDYNYEESEGGSQPQQRAQRQQQQRHLPLSPPITGPAAVEQRALHWISFAQKCIEEACRALRNETGKSVSNARSSPTPLSFEDTIDEGAGFDGNGIDEKDEALAVGDLLAAAHPYQISLTDLSIQVLHASVPPSQLAYVINGAIVGLCEGPEQPNDPSLCLGVGLVRAVDAETLTLYVLSPVPLVILQTKVKAVQLGRLELPSALLQTNSFLSPYLALFSLGTVGTGAGTIKSRKNLLRQGKRHNG